MARAGVRRDGLVAFFGYLTFRAFNATYVWFDPYISPTVAPPFFTPTSGCPGAVPLDHAWFGAFPSWWPPFLPQSPAFFAPALAIAFRLTCYYYRGACYKAAFMKPPNCAVGGAPFGYRGEQALLLFPEPAPLHALWRSVSTGVLVVGRTGGVLQGRPRFGIGVGGRDGSERYVVDRSTFGCHSWRHLIGGRLDCFTCDNAISPGYGLWKGSTWMNERHIAFAWFSLVWVAFTDFYIYLVSSGMIRDLNTVS